MSSTCLPLVRRCRHLLAAAVAATSLIVACGGGVDTGGTGAPAQSYSAGRISGFGSIIVNGVHFDESAASIVDQDGVSRSRSELKLGMIVDIEAGPVTVDPATKKATSVASKVQIRDEIKGPVESVNLATGTLVVLGQPIAIDLDTVFSGLPAGLASVAAGQQLEVFAFHDPATGVHAATRIELKANQDEYELRGVIADLDTAAKTFKIGDATIRYDQLPAEPAPPLENGLAARVDVLAVQQGGVWIATKVRTDKPEIDDGAEAEVEGIVNDFVSLADFRVNGVAVDASGSDVKFKGGNSGHLANGVQAEIEGTMHGDVLVAEEVDIKKKGGGEDEKFELFGPVESVNVVERTFVLRGETVAWDNETDFKDASINLLQPGAEVEVKGMLTNNGTLLYATKIEFSRGDDDDDDEDEDEDEDDDDDDDEDDDDDDDDGSD